MVEITVNLPNKPKGKLIPVHGIGYLENGQTHTLSDEQLNNYKARHNTSPPTLVGRPLEQEEPPPTKNEEYDSYYDDEEEE